MQSHAMTNKIAVIGSGIAGLSAAWLLSQRFKVSLFEANSYLGGHTNTVDVNIDGVSAPVDTGFLVFNDRTYPNLVALFAHLKVQHAVSDMSFSVRIDEENLEWAGSSLATIFAQKRNLIKPEFWRMLKEILRFNRESTQALLSGDGCEGSIGDFLERRAFGRAFRDWYLLPMSGAIWSCPTQRMLDYPVETFLRFCHNHGLLGISDRPVWKTVRGGGREYVRKLAAGISEVRLCTPVLSARRSKYGVSIRTEAGATEMFDQAIFACHSDQTLNMIADLSDKEHSVLSRIGYQMNEAVLHTDISLLPRSRDAWAAWNYIAGSSGSDGRPVSVSYLINRLQPLPFEKSVVVTLNPTHVPKPELVIKRFQYAHPSFDRSAIEAQRELPQLQGQNNTWFCGAWTGYGFHEDGLTSALRVVNALGVAAPWQKSGVVTSSLRGAA
ncbi:MAG: NAD(P)-binding protein [Burkholderiales bacterium]|nr:NAD(P)-binding protein [Burkholderiales bacterium]